MKTKLICLLMAIALISCKKTEVQPNEPIKTVLTPVYNYTLTIIPNYIHYVGDTLKVWLNGNLLISKVSGSIANNYSGIKVKTGDRLKIYYNPGIVLWGNDYITDENNLSLFLDSYQIWETKCKCVLNYDKILN